MSKASDFVSVTISRETARVTRTGFGTSLLFGPHYHIPETERVRTYSDPADMLTDGFLTTDDLYKAALILMSQELSPLQFKVARKNDDVNSKATLAFTGTPTAGTWTLDIGIGDATPVTTGAITYTADDDTAAIETAIEALTGVTEVTVTGLYSTGYTIEFTGVDAAADFRITGINISSLTGVTAATATMTQYGSATETWDTGLAAIKAKDDDWYFLVGTTRTKADILLLAAGIEASISVKKYFVCTGEADVKNGVADNTLLSLEALAYDKTSYLYSGDYAVFPEAGLIGGQSPKDPGSSTWKFKTIVGVTPDILTTTEFNNIVGHNGNVYEEVGGVNIISSEATVVSGEYIDIIRGTDWLQVRLTEDLFELLVNSDKLGFTEPDLGAVYAKIKFRMDEAENDAKLLVPNASVINVPKLSTLDPADKTIRLLDDVTFSGTYQGAIHKINLTGKLSL